MDKLISVIIPAYNVEKYLAKCLNTVLEQTYKNLEIIIVDDGSADNTGKICDEYAEKDSRIKVIHKENGGVSAARNDAIDIATGEYITFVDSDDLISNDYCEKMLTEILNNDAEVSICMVKRFVEGEEFQIEPNENVNVYTAEETIYNLMSVSNFYDYACGKMYLRTLFDGIRFPLGRRYEDSATNYKLYSAANKVVVIEEELYYYLTRPDSFVESKYTSSKQNDNYLLIEERTEFLINRFPHMKEMLNAGYIRNALTLIERTYLSGDRELMNSEIIEKVEKRIRDILNDIDKNSFENILSNYKLASMYLFLENREIYAKIAKELYTAKYGG